jgi:DNA polymerase sigma
LNQKLKIISEYFINKEQKDTFDSLLINIKTKINKNFKYNFNLYPYGSVTEFLGSKTSDIDV